MFAGSLFIAGFLGGEFAPAADEGQFYIRVQTPIGTSLDGSSIVLAEIERRIAKLPCVTDTFTTIGAGVEERVNVATILTNLVPKHQRRLDQADIMAMAREAVADLDHLDVSVEMVPRISGGGFRSAPLQYSLRGPEFDELVQLSETIMDRVSKVPGIVDLNSSFDSGKPEISIQLDRQKARDLGVSTEDVGKAVHTLIGGRKAGTFEQGGESYDVRVRLVEEDRDRPEAILGVPVRSAHGNMVELRNFVRIEETTGPVQIDREDRSRQITVFGNLEKSKKLQAALEDIARIEQEIEFPPGVTSKITGEGEMMAESNASIYFSLALAVVLIYMVLAAQFESLIHPFTVMLSLPLSIVGALGLLALTGRTLNIFSMIGMIMLMGLATKNAILLIDYTNLLRRRGLSKKDAILQAGPVRLRPILMTATSTIAGMIPVAIGTGSGAETRAPMGTAIVGGMVTSTILTLVVIPVVYSLMDDVATFTRRLLFGSPTPPTPDLPTPTAPGGNGTPTGETRDRVVSRQ